MVKKSSSYLELEDALAEGGCPICRLGRKTGRRYLDGLLFESVNDPEIRAKLDTAFGFCARHHRQMLTFQGERLGVAILEQAFAREARRRLEQVGAPVAQTAFSRLLARSRPEAPASPLPTAGPCPACRAEEETVERAVQTLVQHLENDLDTRLSAAGGLCWPHLGRALAHAPPPEFTALTQMHRAILSQVIDDLGEFIRKRDYRFRHEPLSEAEADAIVRAMGVLAGEIG